MIGQTISHYKMLEKLGEGGMGVVYKAQDTRLDRLVALKFLPPHLAAEEQDRQRLIQEAKAASALDHPNVCTIHEIDQTSDGHMFIVMAVYEGIPLSKKIEARPVNIPETLDIALQIAEGLNAAHKKEIIHRDIKSSNVMVTHEGQVKIMDFGLARKAGATRLTKTGSTVGTVVCMSPEQARGENVDHRTDIWSLGVIMYEMITGQLPFKSEYYDAVVYSILNEDPSPVSGLRTGVPMELERIIKKAMQKDRANRYQHVDELLTDLRSLKREIDAGIERPQVQRVRPSRKRRVYGYVLAGVILAAAATLIFLLPSLDEKIDSIAVLPLENLNRDPEQQYFADGMTEALITQLSKIGALKVISRTSVMQYKDVKKPLPQIARELGVDALIEGSVLREGGQARITVKLIRGPSEENLWAESYERELRGILALQGEVARAIANEVRVKLTLQEQTRLGHAHNVNPQAYEHYLRGRYYWNQRTGEGLKRSLELFGQAIKVDSGYALAYAGMADTYLTLYDYGLLQSEESTPKALAAARKALELDPHLAEAHNSLAHIHLHQWAWHEAEQEFRRALELDPGYTLAYHWFALCLTAMGRVEEAVAAMEKAQQLDPLSLRINADLGMAYLAARQANQAIAQETKTLELDTNFRTAYWIRGMAYEQKGQYTDAIRDFQEAVKRAPGNPNFMAALAHAHSAAGRTEEARKLLAQMNAAPGGAPPFFLALVYTGLGELSLALDALEKAYQEHSGSMRYLKVEPRLDPLRDQPRFKDLLRRMNLATDPKAKS